MEKEIEKCICGGTPAYEHSTTVNAIRIVCTKCGRATGFLPRKEVAELSWEMHLKAWRKE